MLMFQYVSCSWDQSIRVWNAWKKQVKRKEPGDEEEAKGDNQGRQVELSVEEEEEEGEEQGEGQTTQEGETQGEADGDEEEGQEEEETQQEHPDP